MVEVVRAAVLTGFAEVVGELGLDPLRLLDQACISRTALTNPDLVISGPAVRDLFEQCGRTAENFGLRLSQKRTPSAMGPVALLLREQPTVRDALQAFARYLSLHSEAATAWLEELDDTAILHHVLHYATPGPVRQVDEMSLGQLMNVLTRFLGAEWRPLDVSFIHAPPRSLATHHQVFGPHVSFDQAFVGIVLARADLDSRNPFADAELARHIEGYVATLAGDRDADLSRRVRDLIRRLLPTGGCSAEDVARQLGADVRTLQRRLAQEGVSFGEIMQETRRMMAMQFVENSDRPMADVAELLGFSALSAFSRWHQTHCGQSPMARREAARRSKA